MNEVRRIDEVGNALLFLIVDDDELSRELLPLLLEADGYSVEVAASGDEALARISNDSPQPDVILTDMQMPGTSGSSLAAALRDLVPRTTKLLAMSGSQPSISSLEGFDGFLLKPFTMDDLRDALGGRDRVDLQASAVVASPGGNGPEERLTEIPAINEKIYTNMCEIMSESQLREMYAMTIADSRKRIALMAKLAAAGDDKQYRLEAHAIKGSAGFVGASELFQLAGAVERHGLNVDAKPNQGEAFDAKAGTSGVTATLDQFSLACDRLERILVERL